MKGIIDNKKLLNLGFTQVDNKSQTEDGILFDWFELDKRGIKIELAKEYGYQGKCVVQVLYLEGEKMKGFKGIKDINNLIGLVG